MGVHKIIKSDFPTKIFDPDGNEISVNMFNYNSIKNILFSQGNIQLSDKNKNIYKFSELYIDEKMKKIVGSDAKIFFNDNSMKENPDNNLNLSNIRAHEKIEAAINKIITNLTTKSALIKSFHKEKSVAPPNPTI